MKHKHSEVIKAFVDGDECQYYNFTTRHWEKINALSSFDYFFTVRIKPKPDVVTYLVERKLNCWHEITHVALTKNVCNGYIRIVRDGETGKIKESRII
jgi:hypothetical protein